MSKEADDMFKKWISSLPKCVGFDGGCDGDLEGMEHEIHCPMYGKKHTTLRDGFDAALSTLHAERAAVVEMCAEFIFNRKLFMDEHSAEDISNEIRSLSNALKEFEHKVRLEEAEYSASHCFGFISNHDMRLRELENSPQNHDDEVPPRRIPVARSIPATIGPVERLEPGRVEPETED